MVTSCKKNKVDPDSLISIQSYYKTDPTSGDTIFAFHIPTGFSPNGDGINEYWQPITFMLDSSVYLVNVIGENGKIIFESKTPAPFNGKVNGEPLTLQTLGYYIEAKDKQGEKHYFKGKFIILK